MLCQVLLPQSYYTPLDVRVASYDDDVESTWAYCDVVDACCQDLSQVAAPLCAPLHLLAPARALPLPHIPSLVWPQGSYKPSRLGWCQQACRAQVCCAQRVQLHTKGRTRQQPGLLSILTWVFQCWLPGHSNITQAGL